MMTKLCTETFGLSNPASIETYIKCEGYKAWRNIVSNKSLNQQKIKFDDKTLHRSKLIRYFYWH